MSSTMKWGILIAIAFGFIFVAGYYFLSQNNTVRTTSNVEFILQNTNVGEARLHADTAVNITSAELLNKEELVANLVAHVVEEQTNENYGIQIQYAFTDKDNKPTVIDKEIRGIYFIVNTLNEDDEIISSAERRLALDVQFD